MAGPRQASLEGIAGISASPINATLPNMEMELASRGTVDWSTVLRVCAGAAARSSFPVR